MPSLIELDEYLGQAFRRMPVAMIVVNHRGLITRVNELAEITFGYAASELIGERVEILIPERFREAHPGYRTGFLAETAARPMGLGRDLSGRRKDGSEFPVEIGINPVETGEGTMILSVIVDLSERKQAEKRIQDALSQKDLLLKEVHHRVKNNLQIIHSLLDLQVLQLTDGHIIDVLRDSQNRIRSMSLIHQTLYQSRNFVRVDFQQFLDELMRSLMESQRVGTDEVSVGIDAHEIELPINEAIPCGLIINELVSNAFKHGFRGRGRGHIQVSVQELSDRIVELAVSDDGTGIPDDLDLERTGTLGIQLVQLLGRQLNGSLQVDRARPTRFVLRFPLGTES
ncbi:MAG: histidine kinase dimerization/phosphoacceptor domain -containing protein [Burkholderiaceae bacterium]